MQNEIKQPFFFLFTSLTLYNLLFFRVTVSKHKLVYCAKKKEEKTKKKKKTKIKKVNNTMTHAVLETSKHWYSIEVWGPPRPLPIIQEVFSRQLGTEKRTTGWPESAEIASSQQTDSQNKLGLIS